MLGNSSKKDTSVSEMVIDGEESNNRVLIADYLNDYFSNVASDLMNNSALMGVGNPMSYLTGDFRNSFSYHPVLPNEINSVILSLKNKSNNIYCIPVKNLKKISFIISPILASITNNSVFSGTFPSILKLANVIPLH